MLLKLVYALQEEELGVFAGSDSLLDSQLQLSLLPAHLRQLRLFGEHAPALYDLANFFQLRLVSELLRSALFGKNNKPSLVDAPHHLDLVGLCKSMPLSLARKCKRFDRSKHAVFSHATLILSLSKLEQPQREHSARNIATLDLL